MEILWLFRFVFRRKIRHHAAGSGSITSPKRSSRGGDYADLYFEYLATSSISIDESIVKSATQGVSLGLGVRVISGERTGYAYSDDLSPEKIRHAAQVAAMIAAGPAKVEKTPLEEGRKRNLYPVLTAPNETAFRERVELAQRADHAARAYDPRVFQVQVTYADNLRQVLVATSDGMLNYDRQPMTRMSVFVLARDSDGVPQQGHAGGGGRYELDCSRRCARRNTSPEKPRGRRLCNSARWKLRQASRSWCWVQAGPACCCMKPSATVSKPISTAKAFRHFPGASANRWRARSAP